MFSTYYHLLLFVPRTLGHSVERYPCNDNITCIIKVFLLSVQRSETKMKKFLRIEWTLKWSRETVETFILDASRNIRLNRIDRKRRWGVHGTIDNDPSRLFLRDREAIRPKAVVRSAIGNDSKRPERMKWRYVRDVADSFIRYGGSIAGSIIDLEAQPSPPWRLFSISRFSFLFSLSSHVSFRTFDEFSPRFTYSRMLIADLLMRECQ